MLKSPKLKQKKEVIVKVTGTWAWDKTKMIAAEMNHAFKKSNRIVLDISEADFFSSNAVALIVTCFGRAKKEKGDFFLIVDDNIKLRELLNITNLSTVMAGSIYRTLADFHAGIPLM
jgi:anti-anti-sigma factor